LLCFEAHERVLCIPPPRRRSPSLQGHSPSPQVREGEAQVCAAQRTATRSGTRPCLRLALRASPSKVSTSRANLHDGGDASRSPSPSRGCGCGCVSTSARSRPLSPSSPSPPSLLYAGGDETTLSFIGRRWQSMILGSCRQGAAPRGGMVGEVDGYLWMRRRSADATREEAAAAVRRAMRRKMVCVVSSSYFVRRS